MIKKIVNACLIALALNLMSFTMVYAEPAAEPDQGQENLKTSFCGTFTFATPPPDPDHECQVGIGDNSTCDDLGSCDKGERECMEASSGRGVRIGPSRCTCVC